VSGSSGGIFLSYRREDAAPYARLLQYQLSERFPGARVFMDLDSIEAGLDFAEVIRDALDSSAVLVILIGRQWATVADEEGRRRLDDPDDYVRFEVQTALKRGVRVIPVLVDNARPLRQQQLPTELHKLARLNALELSYGRYQYDSGRLLDLIQRVLAAAGDLAEAGRRAQDEDDRQAQTEPERQAQARRLGQAAIPPERQPDSRPTEVLSGPQALAATLTHGSRWLTVYAVAFSPDGHLLASGLEDAGTRLWDSTTGDQLRTLHPDATFWSEMTGPVHAVAFSPDGRLLASVSEDKTLRLWDPATGQHRRTLTGHARGIWGVAFSPDGRLLASASEDKTVRLWDPGIGRHERTLTGHARGIWGVAFSPDGRLLASAGEDKTVRLWDPATGRHERTLAGHAGPVNAVAFSPDGRMLASVSDDKTVRLWDLAAGQHGRTLMGPLMGHTGWVRSVAFSPGGRLLASASDDKTVWLWDPATGHHRRTLTGHTGPVRSVAFSPDGRVLASAGDDGTVRLWR
jgi:predicted NACHT family NTPase